MVVVVVVGRERGWVCVDNDFLVEKTVLKKSTYTIPP
jgi:hypothetical protein